MGRSITSILPQHKRMTGAQAVWRVMSTLFLDIIVFSSLVPLLGTYLAGSCATQFLLSPRWELVSGVIFTTGILYGSFAVFGEANFWKSLFVFDEFYVTLLKFRDLINSCIVIICLVSLSMTIELMTQDKEMKPHYLGEGSSYIYMRTVITWLKLDTNYLAKLGLQEPEHIDLTRSWEKERFEHAAAYVLIWGILTASVAKAVYFNTLFTYIKAMRIFVSLRPSFEDDDDSSSSDSSDNSVTTHEE